MNSRERFHCVVDYGNFDRGIFAMPWFGFPGTFERWEKEGFRPEHLQGYDVDQWVLGYDLFFPHPPFENKIVEEDERTVLFYNHEGILMREFKDSLGSSMPQFVRFPVETREDFERFAKEHLSSDLADSLGPEWKAKLHEYRFGDDGQDKVLWLYADRWGGLFGPLRNLMGIENLCVAFHTDPGFVERMMDFITERTIRLAGQILDHIEIDLFGLWEDMAYNHGPLISPEMVRRFMLPRYKKITEYIRGRGVKHISLDSDGNVTKLIPIWLEAGIDFLYPFEVSAGMDVVEMRKIFGKDLRMYGGIDKKALVKGPDAIDAEIARVWPVVEQGGYVPNVDHSLPPDISFRNFQHYMTAMCKRFGIR